MHFLKILLSALLLQVSLVAGLTAQQTLVVDATNSVALPIGAQRHPSITSAANAATASDTILVVGITDGSGNPLAYADATSALYPYQQPENFAGTPGNPGIPIPAGVTIRPYNSTRVYVWSTTGTDVLFRILPPGAAGVPDTRIEDITFIGATTEAISLKQTGGHDSSAVLKGVALSGNKIGLASASHGVTMAIDVENCWISSEKASASPLPPAYQTPSIGLQFHADDHGNDPGVIDAEIVSLNTAGPFNSTAPASWLGNNDLQGSFQQGVSRLVEVFATGEIREYADLNPSQGQVNYTQTPISEVRLDVQGGVWGVDATQAFAWDVGLYAHTIARQTGTPWDYYAGYEVDFSGTQIGRFQVAGIQANALVNSRGTVRTTGQTKITSTGPGIAHNTGSYLRSGVHMYALEGYLGFVASDTLLRGNTGHGAWFHCDGEILAIPYWVPQGLYVEMENCGVHENQGSGLAFRVGNFAHGGVVGGTAHYTYDPGLQVSLRNLSDDGESFGVGFGQGAVDRCAISNNGENGVWAHSNGLFNTADPNAASPTVSCRLTNDIIWNNPVPAKPTLSFAGVQALMEVRPGGLPSEPRGLMLMPILHCALAGNGAGAGWSAIYEDGADAAIPFLPGRYEWNVAQDPFMATIFANSIFYQDLPSGQNLDFGPNLENDILNYDDRLTGNGQFPILGEIGFSGIRSNSGKMALGPWSRLSSPDPFVGPYAPTSLLPSQFFLDANAGNILEFQNDTPTTGPLTVPAPETTLDFQGQTRPGSGSGQRDKGADEL